MIMVKRLDVKTHLFTIANSLYSPADFRTTWPIFIPFYSEGQMDLRHLCVSAFCRVPSAVTSHISETIEDLLFKFWTDVS